MSTAEKAGAYFQEDAVCLMSQSWDNVASMHDLVHAHKT